MQTLSTRWQTLAAMPLLGATAVGAKRKTVDAGNHTDTEAVWDVVMADDTASDPGRLAIRGN